MSFEEIAQKFEGITNEEGKKVFRRLVITYHPDRGGSEETMKMINEIWEKFQKGEKVFKSKNWEQKREEKKEEKKEPKQKEEEKRHYNRWNKERYEERMGEEIQNDINNRRLILEWRNSLPKEDLQKRNEWWIRSRDLVELQKSYAAWKRKKASWRRFF